MFRRCHLKLHFLTVSVSSSQSATKFQNYYLLFLHKIYILTLNYYQDMGF